MIQTNLKELLNRNNISINKLSIETGLSRPTLTSLMNNESKGIQFDTLEKLLDYFNISISDFFSVYNEEIIFNFLSDVPLSKAKIMEESPFSVERKDNYVEFNPSELISYKCCIEIDGKPGKPFGGALTPVMDNEKIVAMGLVFFRSDIRGNSLPIQDVKTFIKKLDSEALGSLVEKILNNWYKRYKIIKKVLVCGLYHALTYKKLLIFVLSLLELRCWTKSEQREITRFNLNCSFRGAESADFVRHCCA